MEYLNDVIFYILQEDPPPGKCLGVFGLSLYTTEREVRSTFERYGRVADCRIVHDRAVSFKLCKCLLIKLQLSKKLHCYVP